MSLSHPVFPTPQAIARISKAISSYSIAVFIILPCEFTSEISQTVERKKLKRNSSTKKSKGKINF